MTSTSLSRRPLAITTRTYPSGVVTRVMRYRNVTANRLDVLDVGSRSGGARTTLVAR